MHAAQTQTAHRCAVFGTGADEAADERDLDGLALRFGLRLGHD